jgi:hypothetical protein
MTQRFAEQREREQHRQERGDLRERMITLVDEAGEDAMALFAEFEALLDVYRPTAKQLDPETDAALAEAFNPGVRVEMEMKLRTAQAALGDLVGKAREYLDRESDTDDADPAEIRFLEAELAQAIERRREILEWVRRRAALLRPVKGIHLDPMQEFRRRHDDRDFVGALGVLGGRQPQTTPDCERLLHCLAQVGDFERYRRLLLEFEGDRRRLKLMLRGDIPTGRNAVRRSDAVPRLRPHQRIYPR